MPDSEPPPQERFQTIQRFYWANMPMSLYRFSAARLLAKGAGRGGGGGGVGGELEILNTERWNDERCPPICPFFPLVFVKIYSAGTHWCISIAPWCIVRSGTIFKHLSAEGSQHGLDLALTCTISLGTCKRHYDHNSNPLTNTRIP